MRCVNITRRRTLIAGSVFLSVNNGSGHNANPKMTQPRINADIATQCENHCLFFIFIHSVLKGGPSYTDTNCASCRLDANSHGRF